MCTEEPYIIDLRLASPAGDTEEDGQVALLLPHEVFSAIHAAGEARWKTTIGTETMFGEYWKHTLENTTWGSSHPAREKADFPHKVVPIAVYGDSARVTKDESILVLTWNAVTAFRETAQDSRFVIAAVPTPHLLESSIGDLCRVISWSMGAMYDGVFPESDHLGRAWAQHSPRSFRAGSVLAKGFSATLCEARGDWEFMAKWWHTPTAGNGQPCWRCGCHREGPLRWTNLASTAPWRGTLPPVPVQKNPLERLPGWHRDMLRIDLMHTACLGVFLWVGGAAMVFLCRRGTWGGGPAAAQLVVGWKRFQEWLHQHGLRSSQRLFTPKRLTWGGSEYVELLSKAWNARLIICWLDAEFNALGLVEDEEGKLTGLLVWLCNESAHLCEAQPRALSKEVANKYHSLVNQAVTVYKELAFIAYSRGDLRYPLRPKLHLWLELAEVVKADCYNPRWYHTFSDEGFLKLVLRAARKSPRVSMSNAVIRRYLLRLSLRWSGRLREPRRRVLTQPKAKRGFKLRTRL